MQGWRQVQRPLLPFQALELSLQSIDLIDDSLRLIFDDGGPGELHGADGHG